MVQRLSISITGVPSAQERDAITRDVKSKLTGARGQKVIVAFNESSENKASVEDISLNDAAISL